MLTTLELELERGAGTAVLSVMMGRGREADEDEEEDEAWGGDCWCCDGCCGAIANVYGSPPRVDCAVRQLVVGPGSLSQP